MCREVLCAWGSAFVLRPLTRRAGRTRGDRRAAPQDTKLFDACKKEALKFCNSSDLFPEPGSVLSCLRCVTGSAHVRARVLAGGSRGAPAGGGGGGGSARATPVWGVRGGSDLVRRARRDARGAIDRGSQQMLACALVGRAASRWRLC